MQKYILYHKWGKYCFIALYVYALCQIRFFFVQLTCRKTRHVLYVVLIWV